MTDQKYILDDGHNIIPVSLLEWAHWFGTAERHVAATKVGPYWVSTVFLGIDHRFGGGGPPILFETMVFKNLPDTTQYGDGEGWSGFDTRRYATWEEAVAGHKAMVAKVKRRKA